MVKHAPSKGFSPTDLSNSPPLFQLPDEIWISMLSAPCSFSPEHFSAVMLNLIKNPNLSSSYLFRAEIFYDSVNDVTVSEDHGSEHFSGFTKHMKAEYQPRRVGIVPGFTWQRTFVRRLIPRNAQLDRALVQTCHLFSGVSPSEERSLVIYLPHASSADEVPYYHPCVQSLAMLHTWNSDGNRPSSGIVSIHYRLFSGHTLTPRLTRTALVLLQLTHKHGQGQVAGYVKRVHHDVVIPQSRFQDTYARLKAKYAKKLIEGWVEATNPTKHVFEDLGIAAFLVELWGQMYKCTKDNEGNEERSNGEDGGRKRFPGFVDIGCGNGVLVYVLRQERYQGWGFDARKRKAWDVFPPELRESLKEMLLVPDVLPSHDSRAAEPGISGSKYEHRIDFGGTVTAASGFTNWPNGTVSGVTSAPAETLNPSPAFHNGIFPPGTFIISNHADELTGWTPLLAYLSDSPFVAIPCCSHNLAGARFRAPASSCRRESNTATAASDGTADPDAQHESHGTLKKPGKGPSAYASLCTWVESLAQEVGFVVEREMLRIPSTRNVALLGRRRKEGDGIGREISEERKGKVVGILEREVGDAQEVERMWIERAMKIAKSKGDCH